MLNHGERIGVLDFFKSQFFVDEFFEKSTPVA